MTNDVDHSLDSILEKLYLLQPEEDRKHFEHMLQGVCSKGLPILPEEQRKLAEKCVSHALKCHPGALSFLVKQSESTPCDGIEIAYGLLLLGKLMTVDKETIARGMASMTKQEKVYDTIQRMKGKEGLN